MRIKSSELKTVVYVCEEREIDGQSHRVPIGTGFIIACGHAQDAKPIFKYLVTARHIVDRHFDSSPLYIRVNTKADSVIHRPVTLDNFTRHDEADVAALNLHDLFTVTEAAQLDILGIPIEKLVGRDGCYTGPPFQNTEGIYVGIGDEVAIPGLFVFEEGDTINLPICRFGRIARLLSEINIPRFEDDDDTKRPGYLIESLSWGGESGSPVLWLAGPTSHLVEGGPERPGRHAFYGLTGGLLGLVSAHVNLPKKSDVEPQNAEISKVTAYLNSGIAKVTPAHAIFELLNGPEFSEQRNASLKSLRDYEGFTESD